MKSRRVTERQIFLRLLVLLILLTGLCRPTAAEQLQSTMLVQATVVSACRELKTNPLTFGDYTQGSNTPLNASTTVRVRCSDGVRFALDANVGTSFANGTRRMVSPSPQPATLNYNLYTSSALSQTWGSEASGSAIEGTGTDAEQSITIYGTIPARQSSPLGAYMDSVLVTLTF